MNAKNKQHHLSKVNKMHNILLHLYHEVNHANLFQPDDNDNDIQIPLITKQNTDKFTYFYRHPSFRLLTIILTLFLSCLVISADPIAHSYDLARADVIGNIQNLIFER